jgi:curved DNA-binding protein CbpA
MTKTLYSLFGLPPGSTDRELHAKYLELAQKYHDRGEFAEPMRELNAAWAVLKVASERRKYDAGLALDGLNCAKCKGRGGIFQFKLRKDGPCPECRGTGRKLEKEKVSCPS